MFTCMACHSLILPFNPSLEAVYIFEPVSM
jgi:hypothetical protein